MWTTAIKLLFSKGYYEYFLTFTSNFNPWGIFTEPKPNQWWMTVKDEGGSSKLWAVIQGCFPNFPSAITSSLLKGVTVDKKTFT